MRKLLGGFLTLICYGINAAMMFHLFTSWMAGAPPLTLLAIFVAYFIPMMLVLKGSDNLKEPRAPRTRRKKPKKAALVPEVPQSLPMPPQRPAERVIAAPPFVGAAQPRLRLQSASISPQLRRFVVEGERAIVEVAE